MIAGGSRSSTSLKAPPVRAARGLRFHPGNTSGTARGATKATPTTFSRRQTTRTSDGAGSSPKANRKWRGTVVPAGNTKQAPIGLKFSAVQLTSMASIGSVYSLALKLRPAAGSAQHPLKFGRWLARAVQRPEPRAQPPSPAHGPRIVMAPRSGAEVRGGLLGTVPGSEAPRRRRSPPFARFWGSRNRTLVLRRIEQNQALEPDFMHDCQCSEPATRRTGLRPSRHLLPFCTPGLVAKVPACG